MEPQKLSLVFCELHNKKIHGFTNESTPNINTHYLVIEKIKVSEFYDTNLDETDDKDDEEDETEEYDVDDSDDEEIDLNYYCNSRKNMYLELPKSVKCSDGIRNYAHIMEQPNTYNPQIVQCITLPGEECVAIIKTFWIRWIQRKWKKIYKNRLDIINRRKKTASLIYRERNGNWPLSCSRLPSIQGMLTY